MYIGNVSVAHNWVILGNILVIFPKHSRADFSYIFSGEKFRGIFGGKFSSQKCREKSYFPEEKVLKNHFHNKFHGIFRGKSPSTEKMYEKSAPGRTGPTLQVSDAVVVGVEVAWHVHVVDDGALPPLQVTLVRFWGSML
jgi:hypothetical protein